MFLLFVCDQQPSRYEPFVANVAHVIRRGSRINVVIFQLLVPMVLVRVVQQLLGLLEGDLTILALVGSFSTVHQQ